MSMSRKHKLKKRAAKLAAWKRRWRAKQIHEQRRREGRFAPFFDGVRQLDELHYGALAEPEARSAFDLMDEAGIAYIAVPTKKESDDAWSVWATAKFPSAKWSTSICWALDGLPAAVFSTPRYADACRGAELNDAVYQVWSRDGLLAVLQTAPRLVASAAWAKLLGLPFQESRTALACVG